MRRLLAGVVLLLAVTSSGHQQSPEAPPVVAAAVDALKVKPPRLLPQPTPLASRSEHSISHGKIETFLVTAYTAGYESTGKVPSDSGYGITASGIKALDGITCAAGSQLPFGTKIYIPGLGIRIVQDRGGAVQGNHIDVFMSSLELARQWGRKTLQVIILYTPEGEK